LSASAQRAPAGSREGPSPPSSPLFTAVTPPCCLVANHRLQHGGHMTPHALPDRPSLEQLKNQAKTLLKAAQAGDASALERFALLPAFAGSAADRLAREVALHDAQ